MSVCNHSVSKTTKSCTLPSVYSSFPNTCIEHMWHSRLGHVPFAKMRSISSIPIRFAPKQSFTCTICPMVKQARLPFPISTTFSSKPFDHLHLDLWGPYHMPTHDHYKYFLTIVDDFSRMT